METVAGTLPYRVATEALVVLVGSGVCLFVVPDPLIPLLNFVFAIACFVLADACAVIQGGKPWIFRTLQ